MLFRHIFKSTSHIQRVAWCVQYLTYIKRGVSNYVKNLKLLYCQKLRQLEVRGEDCLLSTIVLKRSKRL